MATTWMKAVHRSNSGSISAGLKQTIDYAKNPDKTQGGELTAAYECDPMTAESEFLLSKTLYEQRTGRNQGKHDVIGYQIRQSFKPGEVTAEQALKIGYDLAMRWTRGKHQFIVAAHTNTANPHTHIFFNSVDLDCSRKFEDFRHSAIALRKISDILCLENGLSVIEKPGLSKGQNRAEYLGDGKQLTGRDKLREIIDNSICVGNSWQDFFTKMKRAGCEIKYGKHLAFRIPGGKKNFRLDSLGVDYSREAITERLRGVRDVAPRTKVAEPSKPVYVPKLLIDIEAKIQQGYGAGFEQWAKLENLKEAARNLIFLQENGIGTYEELVKKDNEVSGDYGRSNDRRKAIDARLAAITETQKYIGNYSKGQAVYREYRAIKNPKKAQAFYEEHRAPLTLRSAAKKYFDEQGFEKTLPSIESLKREYATLLSERKSLGNIKEKRETMIKWAMVKNNVERFLAAPTLPRRTLERGAR
ncbi:hypothetical protein FACS1894105_06900 [Clostridia bacterium]|nr:hypothetical protein FACS1894105_06900 [Clostridia bacterium]